jgi:hypothetical protein
MTMNLFKIVAASLFVLVAANGEDSKSALAGFAALKARAESITATSSEDDVLLILGEPESKGIAGWNNPDTKVWTYLIFTDDSQHLSVRVYFSPKSGCSVATARNLRKEIKKGPLRVSTGTVVECHPKYPPGSEGGFLCHVRFVDGALRTVSVGGNDRVAGKPARGSMIRIEHYGSDGHYVFVDYYSLLLKSITFTKQEGEQGDADQPATAVDSKAEVREEPTPESKGRSQ